MTENKRYGRVTIIYARGRRGRRKVVIDNVDAEDFFIFQLDINRSSKVVSLAVPGKIVAVPTEGIQRITFQDYPERR